MTGEDLQEPSNDQVMVDVSPGQVSITPPPPDRRAQIEADAEKDGQALWERLLTECGPCSCRVGGADADRCLAACALCRDLPDGWPCPAWSGAGYGPGAVVGEPAPAGEPSDFDLRGALGRIERWCYGIASKAQVQGNDELAPTARIIGEEVARALAGHDLHYAGVGDDPDMHSLSSWLRIQRLTHDNGLPPTDAYRTPLDRAARWAHQLADVEAALVEWHGERIADDIGQPVADEVRDALARESAAAHEDGLLQASDAVTPEALARAAAYPNPPTESDLSRAREQHLRLALALGWPP